MPEDSMQELPESHLDQTQDKPLRRGAGWLFVLLALIIAIVAIIISGIQWQHTQSINKQLAQLTRQYSSNQQIQQTLATEMQTAKQLNEQQADYIKQNQATIARLLESLSSNKSTWLVTDAKHLIKLANVILNFEYNVPTTITLLKSADNRLAATGDPKLYKAREMLANEVAELQAVPNVDVAGLYLKLQALRNKTLQLPLATSKYEATTVNNLLSQHQAASDSWWDKSVAVTAHALGKVLIIRRRDKPIQPLLSTKQHIFLSQNIYLLYAQAQWAVLHRQEKIYQASLSELINEIGEFYVPNKQSETILQSLQQLQKENIAPQLPDISGSLTAINTYEQQQAKNEMLINNKPTSTVSTKTKATTTSTAKKKASD